MVQMKLALFDIGSKENSQVPLCVPSILTFQNHLLFVYIGYYKRIFFSPLLYLALKILFNSDLTLIYVVCTLNMKIMSKLRVNINLKKGGE